MSFGVAISISDSIGSGGKSGPPPLVGPQGQIFILPFKVGLFDQASSAENGQIFNLPFNNVGVHDNVADGVKMILPFTGSVNNPLVGIHDNVADGEIMEFPEFLAGIVDP